MPVDSINKTDEKELARELSQAKRAASIPYEPLTIPEKPPEAEEQKRFAQPEAPEEIEPRKSTAEMSEEDQVAPGQESRMARGLRSVQQMAKQAVEQAKEMAKQYVKRVVVRAVLQAIWAVITAIVSFIAATWWIWLIVIGVILLVVIVWYIAENPSEFMKAAFCKVHEWMGGDFIECVLEKTFESETTK